MEKELIFGHQNPDTDAVVAAKAYEYLQKKLGYDVESVILGEMNTETKFILNYFNEPMPRIINSASSEVESVMLVDHNEPQQSVSDIKDVTVTHVVDHHRIAGFETNFPIYYRAEPVGCTSTILTTMFEEHGIELPNRLAGLMLSAIISDTLLFKSPTTTDRDIHAVKILSSIANVDYESYGIQMLKSGTNLDSKTDADLVSSDAKSFKMASKNIRIDQINTVDLNDILIRENGLKKAMALEATKEGYDLFLVLVTNILDSNSELFVYGEPKSIIEKAFNTQLINDRVNLPGVVSRKSQVVPPLQKAFED